MLYKITVLLSRIVCLLPQAWRRGLGVLLGQLCWPFVPAKRKQMAIQNCRTSLKVSQAEAARIVKASTTRFGPMFMEVLSFPVWLREPLEKSVRFLGQEHLDKALSQGHGVVLATAHSGNWELMGAALARAGYPIVGVAQKQTNSDMDHFINDYRRQTGLHITYKTGVREMVRLLGEGRIIGLLMDQDAHAEGIFVPFFDRIASTPQGSAALARLKGAPIVPAFITEESPGHHLIILHPPLEVVKTANREDDLYRTTFELTQMVEQHIRNHPAEWFWLHNRWKTPVSTDNPKNTSV